MVHLRLARLYKIPDGKERPEDGVDVDSNSGHRESYYFTLDPETDYCYSTTRIRIPSSAPGIGLTVNGLREDAHNSDQEPGGCTLK